MTKPLSPHAPTMRHRSRERRLIEHAIHHTAFDLDWRVKNPNSYGRDAYEVSGDALATVRFERAFAARDYADRLPKEQFRSIWTPKGDTP